MAVFKCKMCGGDLNIIDGAVIAVCEYCGSKQTVPAADNEKKLNLFNRANRLRMVCEFDKAATIYENIIAEFPEEPEAYWGLCLCNYGIEYVDDPGTGEKKPTCHRVSFESLQKDDNFKLALDYADVSACKVYRDEAREVDRIMEEILSISRNEKPYDVFICYKEKDDNGERTPDSVLSHDIYDALTAKGLKVFFARITLEDKLGTAYEPYIFAALNSAKVMLTVGTKFEYFNAVWVRNEWSRFLKLMQKDKTKVLIPCFKDIDPYDIPEEFSHLQAQDMGKIGFVQDLVHGVLKIVGVRETKIYAGSDDLDRIKSIIERAYMFLKDGNFSKANDVFEQALNVDHKSAEAYLGKLLADNKVKKLDELKNSTINFETNENYQMILRFGNTMFIESVNECLQEVKERIEAKRKDEIYLNSFKNMKSDILECYKTAAEGFNSIKGWKDADEKLEECRKKIEEIHSKNVQATRLKKRKKTIIISSSLSVISIIVFLVVLFEAIIPYMKFNKAMELMDAGKYEEAIIAFDNLGSYKGAHNYSSQCKLVQKQVTEYQNAVSLLNSGKNVQAAMLFGFCGDYKDSREQSLNLWNSIAIRETVVAGDFYSLAVKNGGTVVSVGENTVGQCDVADWKEIIAVSAGRQHTVGLKSDGTVVAVGYNDAGQCDVFDWTDIVAVSVGEYHTVGLKSDGTVVSAGSNYSGQYDASEWDNIIAVIAGDRSAVGLKSDGTVVATGFNDHGQCNVSQWKDIVAVSAGELHTVGLKNDGTVVAVGDNSYGQCDVSEWKDIVAVSGKAAHTIGLKRDGTVVAVGDNSYGQCDVSDWENIVAVSAGNRHTIGLKSDGTIVSTEYDGDLAYYDGQCDIGNWTNIKLPNK